MSIETTTTPEGAELLTNLQDGVLLVTFNRPHRLNATTPEMMRAYMQALLDAGDDPKVKAIVLTGAGGNFCSGVDASVLSGLANDGPRTKKLRRHWFTMRIPKPIIAAISGHCVGLGLAIAMMCDLRVAGHGARLRAPFARLGLPAENGLDWALARSVGYSRAFEILALGEPMVGEELMRLGLVNRVVDDDQVLPQALAMARQLATQASPTSLALIKAQLQRCAHSSLQEADRLADHLIGHCLKSGDFREAIAARQDKRSPTFSALPTDPGWWPADQGPVFPEA